MHINDRINLASNIGLELEEFDRLLASANRAYQTIKDLGPFYGRPENKEPTFRIAAAPVTLPADARPMLEHLGNDILRLARTLPDLPSHYKDLLGPHLDYTIPPTWRVDVILDEAGDLKVNEIEGVDSASALMVAEQLAYGLQNLEQSTASRLSECLQRMYPAKRTIKLALIRVDIENNIHTPNARKFIEFIRDVSGGGIQVDLLDEAKLRNKITKPKWEKYDGVVNQSALFPAELEKLGLRKGQLIAAGNYSAITNKGVFALLFDKKLKRFWIKTLGRRAFKRLRGVIINTQFINGEADFNKAKKAGMVIKISWAGNDMTLVNRSKGVALPEGDIEHSSEERWSDIAKHHKNGYQCVAQEFIRPARIKAYLRKKGTNLEKVNWYNRVCVKYVCNDDPANAALNSASVTAIEVTLGPDVIPAGRACAFTAGVYSAAKVRSRRFNRASRLIAALQSS